MIETLLHKALEHLRCPRCQADHAFEVKPDSRVLHCQQCQSSYSYAQGFVDFLPELPSKKVGLSQRFMENSLVVSVYEGYFRPLFTALGSPIKYDEEETWLAQVSTRLPVKLVLDLAAGTGRYARLLAEQYQPDLVIAADVSVPMIRQGIRSCQAQGFDNILYVRADAQQLPFRSAEFDRLNCFGALHLFPDPPGAIRELGRVAKPGAALTCLTACEYSQGWKVQAQGVFSRLATFRFFSESELKSYLHQGKWGDIASLRKEMLLMFSAVAR